MRLVLTIAISALMLTGPVSAKVVPPAPSAPVSNAPKTDFTKPFIDDRLVRSRLKTPQDHPSVELKAVPQP